MAEKITSSQNPSFRAWKKLLHAKGVKKAGEFLLMGRKTVPEIMAEKPGLFSKLLCGQSSQVQFSVPEGVEVIELETELFNELDEFGTSCPIALGKVPEIESFSESDPVSGVELLVPLGDPANLGALIRSAEAFGVNKVILLEESAHPFSTKALRAASGSTFRTQFFWGPPLKKIATPCLALDMNGENLFDYTWPQDFRFLVGEEGPGLAEDSIHKKIRVPMVGKNESLNAMVATSIALAFISQQRA